MPTLQLKLHPLVPASKHVALARDLTALAATLLDKRPQVTAVMIEALPAGHWYIDGRAVTQATAWLEISITAGTNTPAQKAEFVEQAHAALHRHLAGTDGWAEASYVIVRELPAGDWGYDGCTQWARQQARAAQAK